ncbi:hypothetical protein NG895_12495 [Aeoliella sp. ICT_H6.2]|uniref:Carboxypeptidase regulatory-like domain-containing protein n=1 Tax=Aeoliella straminimaris TaxID=2954799 RepID=A0A9X2JHK3_9BACT|nr:hypothetical protein [Aeoliella straminimaris]MCO6044728.1 hypothetical protein [Aeoliella straminimaris]
MRAVSFLAFSVIAVITFVGCNSGETLAPVAGHVTLDGVPLADAQVIFYPIDDGGMRAFAGFANEQGVYELSEAGADSPGVPPGKYRVSISTAVPRGQIDELTPIPREKVPAKYRDGALEYEVPASGTSDADFNLET